MLALLVRPWVKFKSIALAVAVVAIAQVIALLNKMSQDKGTNKSEILLLLAAISALLAGVLLYLTTRSAQQVLFLNYLPAIDTDWQIDSGGIIYSIPSFLHIYAFILLTSIIISTTPNALRLSCIFWLLI